MRSAAVAAQPFEETTLFSLAASVERSSEHPLAAAIVAAAQERGMVLQEASDFTSVTGQGVSGRVGGRLVSVGNAKLIENRPAAVDALERRADNYRREGATVM